MSNILSYHKQNIQSGNEIQQNKMVNPRSDKKCCRLMLEKKEKLMAKLILLCPFRLRGKIDVFQSNDALIWVISHFYHCDTGLPANTYWCWWAHSAWWTERGCFHPLFFYFHPLSLFSVTVSCRITVWEQKPDPRVLRYQAWGATRKWI